MTQSRPAASHRTRASGLCLGGAMLALLLAGCAVGPTYDLTGVALDLTPQAASATGDPATPTPVIWGGTIVNSTNLEDHTQLEVLAYPVDDRQRPVTAAQPIGRFVVHYPGYLETVTYAPGRELTVSGRFVETRPGRIGEARYTYPIVEADDLHLWRPIEPYAQPRVRFGIGVLLRN